MYIYIYIDSAWNNSGTCQTSRIPHQNEPSTCVASQIVPRNDPGAVPRHTSCPRTILELFHVTHPVLERSWYQFHVAGATQRTCNAPGRSNCYFWSHAMLLQRSRTLQLLLLGSRNAPAPVLDAASAACGATQRYCTALGRCNCCFNSFRDPRSRSGPSRLL